MDEKADIYWLAGFLEGEGYFGLRRQGRSLVLQVGGVDRDVIDHARRAMGDGTIHERPLPSGKTYYGLTVTSQPHAKRIMESVFPFMGARRAARITECLEAYAKVPPPKREWTHCKSGHPLTGPNLKIVREGKYEKRRCIECGRLRQRKYRAKAA